MEIFIQPLIPPRLGITVTNHFFVIVYTRPQKYNLCVTTTILLDSWSRSCGNKSVRAGTPAEGTMFVKLIFLQDSSVADH